MNCAHGQFWRDLPADFRPQFARFWLQPHTYIDLSRAASFLKLNDLKATGKALQCASLRAKLDAALFEAYDLVPAPPLSHDVDALAISCLELSRFKRLCNYAHAYMQRRKIAAMVDGRKMREIISRLGEKAFLNVHQMGMAEALSVDEASPHSSPASCPDLDWRDFAAAWLSCQSRQIQLRISLRFSPDDVPCIARHAPRSLANALVICARMDNELNWEPHHENHNS